MDEQRIREIVREELAKFKQSIQPVLVKLEPDVHVNADAFAGERFARTFALRKPDDG